jgi:hypothetical protein
MVTADQTLALRARPRLQGAAGFDGVTAPRAVSVTFKQIITEDVIDGYEGI